MIYLVTNQKSLFETNKHFSFATVTDVIKYFKDHAHVAFDTETTGFDPYLCKLLSAQFGDSKNQFVVDCETVDIRKFKDLLESKTIIMQNAKFDLKFLYRKKIVPKRIYDTFLAERILTTGIYSHRKALDVLVYRYCKKEMDKTIRGNIHKEGLSSAVIVYAANDVKYLHDIMRKQVVKIVEQDLSVALFLDNEYVKVLAYIEFSGFKLDANKWKAKMEEDNKNLRKAKADLDDWVLNNAAAFIKVDPQLDLFNPNANEPVCAILWSSSKQVIPLFKSVGINTEVKDDKTGYFKDSVDAKVIRPQVKKCPELIEKYLKYKGYEKVVSTYGQTFIDQINRETGKIHTQFTQIMNTGRLSCGGKNKATKEEYINLQNIPRDDRTRSCFIASEGNVLIVSDYSGQEQIVLANQSKDKDIISFYKKGLGDMHSFVASKIFSELADVDLKDIKKNHSEKRQIAKGAGFAINYGGTGYTIAENLAISPAQGEKVYEAYFDAFPGLKNHFKKAKDKAIKNGYILFNNFTKRKCYIDSFSEFQAKRKETQVNGFWTEYKREKSKNSEKFREELSPLVRKVFSWKGNIERNALNYPIQGTSADITKMAGVFLFRYLIEYDLLFKVFMPNVVHDEILLDCPKEIAEEIAIVLKTCMEGAGDKFCQVIKLTADPVITDYWTH